MFAATFPLDLVGAGFCSFEDCGQAVAELLQDYCLVLVPQNH
jgi:hypothetical protein